MAQDRVQPLIYLDHAATTPVLPEVADAMVQAMTESFGNPSSRHGMGLAAERRVDAARRSLGSMLGAPPEQLVFTSGGTEANALGLLGTARLGRPGHLLISAIEHPSVLETGRSLRDAGWEVEELPVTPGGWIDPSEVRARLRSDTRMLAVMHVNNETGVKQPVEEIASVMRERSPHCRLLVDAVQSFAVLPVDLRSLGCDLLTISAHKVHGPKGVGCLVVRPEVRLAPIWGGGDQQRGLRPGTENVPGIVGLARAAELVAAAGPDATGRLAALLLEEVRRTAPRVYPLGEADRRTGHILSLAVPGVRSEVLTNALEERGVIASSGSACHSRRDLRSHVLDAMGVARGHGVVRLSFSRLTTEEHTLRAAALLSRCIQELGG